MVPSSGVAGAEEEGEGEGGDEEENEVEISLLRPLLVPVDSGVNTSGESDESEAIMRGAV